jgi:hypothetical protein
MLCGLLDSNSIPDSNMKTAPFVTARLHMSYSTSAVTKVYACLSLCQAAEQFNPILLKTAVSNASSVTQEVADRCLRL